MNGRVLAAERNLKHIKQVYTNATSKAQKQRLTISVLIRVFRRERKRMLCKECYFVNEDFVPLCELPCGCDLGEEKVWDDRYVEEGDKENGIQE